MWEHKEEPIQLVNIILNTTRELAEAAKPKKLAHLVGRKSEILNERSLDV